DHALARGARGPDPQGRRPPRLMADELRALMWRHMQEIRVAFAAQLAAKLGRPVEIILRDGLRAGDFPLDAAVRVTLCDGSTMELRYAFVVIDEARGALAIFSEHC